MRGQSQCLSLCREVRIKYKAAYSTDCNILILIVLSIRSITQPRYGSAVVVGAVAVRCAVATPAVSGAIE